MKIEPPTEGNLESSVESAPYDALTNLYSRRYFTYYLHQKFDWQSYSLVALLLIDIDHLSKINDNYGHSEGDNILRQLGGIIKETIGDQGLSFRYAGDELAVLLFTDKNKSLKIAEDLQSRVEKTPFQQRNANSKPLAIRISIGLASSPDDTGTAAELIKHADRVLYLSKFRGGHRVSTSGVFPEPDVLEHDILSNFPCPDFIARQEVYQEITQMLNSPLETNNFFVLIDGPIGIGKTRLLKELHSTADVFTFYNYCNETDINIPYKPLISFLTAVAQSNNPVPKKVIEQLPPDRLISLTKLIPSLSKFITASPSRPVGTAGEIANTTKKDDGSDWAGRKKILDSLVFSLSELAKKSPVLLLLDEFQNIDDGTLLMIEALIKTAGQFIIVATVPDKFISAATSPNLVLDQFLAEIKETENYKEFTLPALNLDQTTEMICRIVLQPSVENAFSGKIYQATQGNPLFIEELLKHLIIKKPALPNDAVEQVARENNQWNNVSSISGDIWQKDWDKIIVENADSLDADAHNIIKGAVIIDHDITLNILQETIQNRNQGEIIDALDKIRQLNIIQPVSSSSEDEFIFANKYVRDIIYNSIEEKERQIQHYTVAQIIESKYKDNPDPSDPDGFSGREPGTGRFASLTASGAVSANLAFHFAKAGDEAKAIIYEKKVTDSYNRVFRKDEVSKYYERHLGIIPSTINETTQPLSPQRMGLIKDLLRHLVSTAKSLRFYPDGSQLIIASSIGLIRLVNSIFDELGVFTFSESRNGLNINSFPLDSKNYGGAVDEFLTLLKDHYIKSITLRKGVTKQEIELLLKNMAKSINKCFTEENYWNKFLENNNITHIGIAQRTLRAGTDKTVYATGAIVYEMIEFTTEAITAFKDFFRFFSTSVETVKIYPSGSQLVVQTIKYLDKLVKDILKSVSVLNLSISEEMILINGTPIHNRVFGPSALNFAKLIRNYNLKSISFNKGISKEDIELFTAVLSKTDPEETKSRTAKDWDTILEQNGITNVKIGAVPYVTAELRPNDIGRSVRPSGGPARIVAPGREQSGQEPVYTELVPPRRDVTKISEPLSAKMPAGPQALSRTEPTFLMTQPPAEKDESLFAKLPALFQSSSERFLDDESLRICERLLCVNDEARFNQFYQRFLQNFQSDRSEIRVQANVAFQKLTRVLPANLLVIWLNRTLNVIIESLGTEKVSTAYLALFNSACRYVAYYIENQNYASLKTIVTAILKRKGEKETTRGIAERLVVVIKESAGYMNLVKGLVSADSNTKNTVREIFLAFNIIIVPELLNLIKQHPGGLLQESDFSGESLAQASPVRDAPVRDEEAKNGSVSYSGNVSNGASAIIDIINQMGPPAHMLFTDELKNNNNPSDLKRLMAVAYLVKTEGLEYIIARLVKGPLYEEALKAITNPALAGRAQVLDVLLPLLDENDSTIVKAVLSRLGIIKYEETIEPVIATLEKSTDTEVQQEAIKTLVHLRAEKATAALAQILQAKRFFGLSSKGGRYDEVRKTAAWALGEIRTPAGKEALTSVINDKSAQIRSMAKISLKNYEED